MSEVNQKKKTNIVHFHKYVESRKMVVSSVQSLSHVRLFVTPWTVAH